MWTEAKAAKYLPPRARIAKDMFNACWRVHYGSHWQRSRSWGKYGGDLECIRLLIIEVWRHHASVTGEESHIVLE